MVILLLKPIKTYLDDVWKFVAPQKSACMEHYTIFTGFQMHSPKRNRNSFGSGERRNIASDDRIVYEYFSLSIFIITIQPDDECQNCISFPLCIHVPDRFLLRSHPAPDLLQWKSRFFPGFTIRLFSSLCLNDLQLYAFYTVPFHKGFFGCQHSMFCQLCILRNLNLR